MEGALGAGTRGSERDLGLGGAWGWLRPPAPARELAVPSLLRSSKVGSDSV